ncbi:MAG: SDR family oxidoreductase [Acidimicrobiales bacterium]
MATPPRNQKAPSYVQGHDLLVGKNVVITAAAGTGIGFAVAKRCIEEGATVTISDIHERRLSEAGDRLAEIGKGRPHAVLCNVTVEDDISFLFESAIESMGQVDVLINNAGLGGDTRLVDMSDQQWSAVLDVTLNGTMRATRAALRHMMDRGSGVIVNNASVVGWRAQVGQCHYAAAKAGVMALTRCAALEAAEAGVRINAVSPSLAMHPFLEKVSDKAFLDSLVEAEAFKRSAETWEIANVMVFLASDYSSYMTGETVSVSSQHP